MPADPATPDGAKREYCKVLGAIAPVDPNAPPINFQVNLPAQWNGKAVQYGGGGSNGVLITGLEPVARRAARYAGAGRARLRDLGHGFRPRERRSSPSRARSR